MSSKTETLHHPTLPSTVEVDESAVSDWTDAGWRKSEPVAVKRAVEAAESETDSPK